ncbi:hypothetical protein Droror1_Dr00020004 [Drosera rotundifolia]
MSIICHRSIFCASYSRVSIKASFCLFFIKPIVAFSINHHRSIFTMFVPPRTSQTINFQFVTSQANLLISRADEIRKQVEKQEHHPGHRRKTEVRDWLMEVKEVQKTLQELEKAAKDGSSSSTNTLQNQVIRSRQEIRKLMKIGDFPDGLTLFDESNVVLLGVVKLKGPEFAENLRKIVSWFECGVYRVGVHGAGGIGKKLWRLTSMTNFSKICRYPWKMCFE